MKELWSFYISKKIISTDTHSNNIYKVEISTILSLNMNNKKRKENLKFSFFDFLYKKCQKM